MEKIFESLPEQEKSLPIMFIGHGNPMNAIEDNEFSRGWKKIGISLPRPSGILCISAHWETAGTFVTAMDKPKTIHDFYGFPEDLYTVSYPAPGDPALAAETADAIQKTAVGLDGSWGLDHGCWSVLKNLYPLADIPVVQLSLDHTKPARWHYELAKELSRIRKKGVLIIGSGNMVHNLRMVDWNQQRAGYEWATSVNERFKKMIVDGDHEKLINYQSLGRDALLSIPTPEHYVPLLYVLALREEKDEPSFFNDALTMGSIAMTSVLLTPK